jgi:hyperosmotically inducible protein
MKRYIPTLCLAGLLLACSHENRRESDGARAERGHSSGEERAERNTERAERRQEAREQRDEREERVELRRRGNPDRVASRDTLPAPRDADNTAVNDRDQDSANLTPMDQSNDERDLDITQQIRKSVISDDSLSFGAKNVKIITRGGHVTLRGPVNSAAEKEAIFKAAVTHAGVGHVSNELEVDED